MTSPNPIPIPSPEPESTWTVHEVHDRPTLDAVAVAVTDHSDSSRHLFFPVAVAADDRATSLAEIRSRLWAEHTADPASHWIFVLDPNPAAPGREPEVVGACQWRFYDANPFPPDGSSMPDLTAVWWPPGGGREFVTEFIGQVLRPRVRWMAKPHAGMSWMVVRPDYRRRGIGRALMAWGLQRVDELGLESYVEGTVLGAQLYESCDHRRVADVMLDLKPEEGADETRKRLEEAYIPFGYAVLWRPVGGVWEDGLMQRVWRERLSTAKENGILVSGGVTGDLAL